MGCGGEISIHAPREGCDKAIESAFGSASISIHAPREGCDVNGIGGISGRIQFQSTHPVRGATLPPMVLRADKLFQSTHPVRGATGLLDGFEDGAVVISIHAPREGCDRENGLRIPRYGHSDHSLASIVLYNPLASPQIRKSAESKYQQIIHS